MIKYFFGCVKTLKNYFQTSKARHDLKDYARAACMIFLTTAITLILITILSGIGY